MEIWQQRAPFLTYETMVVNKVERLGRRIQLVYEHIRASMAGHDGFWFSGSG